MHDKFEDLEEKMKPIIFKLAIKGLNLEEKNIEAVRRLLVDQESPQDICADSGFSKSRLYDLKAKVLRNFKDILSENDLVYSENILTKSQHVSVSRKEENIVKNLLLEENNDL